MIPSEYLINDTRDLAELSKKSFSGYAIKDVVTALGKSITGCKIEEVVNWAVELLLSGQTEKFWEKIFNIALKNININNPKLPEVLYKRYSKYVSLKIKHSGSVKSSNIVGFLSLRNSQAIRNLLCEISVIVCNSTKLKPVSLPKIKEQDFNVNYLKTRFIATNPNLVKNKLKWGDPEALKIPFNEFNYCLKAKKWELSIYWIAWILEWEKRNTTKHSPVICGFRKIDGLEDKLCTDLIWIIWEIIIKEASYLNNESSATQIYALFKLFKFDYKPAKKSKRIFFILFAVKFFTEDYNFKHDIIPNYHQLVQACGNINILFFERKKFEVNKLNKQIQHEQHSKVKKTAKTEEEKRLEKAELKRLKEVAQQKIEKKINQVEMIDSMIISSRKTK